MSTEPGQDQGETVPSWKTPGGQQRVYRAEIEALVGGAAPELAAAVFDDPHAALVAIGAAPPHPVAVDLEDTDPGRLALLRSLAANPSLGQARLIGVGGAAPGEPGRVTFAASPAEAAAAARGTAADTRPPAIPHAGAAFPIAPNEGQRLVALERAGLLDTPTEEAFDRLTWLAAQSLDAPISLVAMLTPTRQWFKSRRGIDLAETPRSWAFCNHTILQKDVFWVGDLAADPRFADNLAVACEGGFRFYAGAPILDADGFAVGSLCVIDHKPRTMDAREAQALLALAALGSTEVRQRGAERRLREAISHGRGHGGSACGPAHPRAAAAGSGKARKARNSAPSRHR